MKTNRCVPSAKRGSNCCRPLKTSGGCKPCGPDIPQTLPELVRSYKKLQNDHSGMNGNPLKSLLEGYRELSTFKMAVENACKALDLVGSSYKQPGKPAEPRRHGHQRRIRKTAIQATLIRLKSADRIFADCVSFECVLKRLTEKCLEIPGVGDLYLYDTALRIAAFREWEPECVHLHAGALEGAKALGLHVRSAPLPVSDFPEPIRKLKPHEIEDLLCIYKGLLPPFRIRRRD